MGYNSMGFLVQVKNKVYPKGQMHIQPTDVVFCHGVAIDCYLLALGNDWEYFYDNNYNINHVVCCSVK